MLSALQMSLPGMPSIYYGDEAGLEGGIDPYNRATYPWGREDHDILNWYYKITKIRKEILLEMLFELPEIKCTEDDLLIFRYKNDVKEVHVIVNNDELGGKRCEFINNFGANATAAELIYGEKVEKNAEKNFFLEISPLTTAILVILSQ